MGLIMIRCPATGRAISTGMKASRFSFSRSPVFFGRTFCTICRRDHEWFAKDAWVRELTEKHESAELKGARYGVQSVRQFHRSDPP